MVLKAGYWLGDIMVLGVSALRLSATQSQGYRIRYWWVGRHATLKATNNLLPFAGVKPTASLSHQHNVRPFLIKVLARLFTTGPMGAMQSMA